MNAPTPVLLVAWDSAPVGLVRSMLEAGKLPHLEMVLRDGRLTPVQSYEGLGDDGNWVSFSTGQPPGVHGRFGFHRFGPDSYDVKQHRRDDIGIESFWNRIADRVEKVLVVDVSKSPIGTRDNLVEVADWLSHGPDDATPSMHPAERLNRFVSDWGSFGADPCIDTPDIAPDLASNLDRRRAMATAAFSELLRAEQPDFSVLVYAASHCTGHRFWHLFEGNEPSPDQEDHPLVEQLTLLDRDLATLRSCSPDDVRVGVFSLNGMIETNQRDAVVEEALQRLAAIPRFTDLRLSTAPSRPSSLDRRRRENSLGRRIVPRLPRPLRRRFHTYRTAPETATSAQRRCSPFYSYSQAAVATPIRLNVAGRDPLGWVSADRYDEVCGALVEELMELRDADTGEQILTGCIRVKEAYPNERTDGPDILAVWNSGPGPANAASPSLGEFAVAVVPNRTGEHDSAGWLVTGGDMPVGPDSLEPADFEAVISGWI